jgi:hypothetical protein
VDEDCRGECEAGEVSSFWEEEGFVGVEDRLPIPWTRALNFRLVAFMFY